MPVTRPIITSQRLDAYHGAALRLLTRFLLALLTGGWRGRGRKVRAVVSWFETLVERVIFLDAVLRAGPRRRA